MGDAMSAENKELKVIEELQTEIARTSKALKELKQAITEAIDKSKGIHLTLYPSPKRAAAKRASMDLTRKLAEFRRTSRW
jgi:cell division septum initiation protein DivIVA